ncbi:hypothetical protein JCM1841_004375 [Sporobolomyces salmonicolor]
MATPDQLLLSLLALAPPLLDQSLRLPHVHEVICALLRAPQPPSQDTRRLLHALIARLAQSDALDLGLLTLYCAAFQPSNRALVQDTVETALNSSQPLRDHVRKVGLHALRLALDQVASSQRSHEATALLALLRASAREVLSGPENTAEAAGLLEAIANAYSSLAGTSAASPQSDHLRLSLLTTAHTLLLLPSSHEGVVDLPSLKALLATLLSPPSSDLAIDLEARLGLSADLSASLQGTIGPIARETKDLVGSLRRMGGERGKGGEQAGKWLERLRREVKLGGASEAGVGIGVDQAEGVTGVGVAGGAGGLSPEKEAELASAISSLSDLFPALSPAFLRACLLHPSFFPSPSTSTSESSERVVAAVLEESLPADLRRLRDHPEEAEAPEVTAAKEEMVTVERRNIFDEDRTFSRGVLMQGKGKEKERVRPNPTFTATSRQLDEQLKASIIALAEAPSSDEDEGAEGEAFLDDFDAGPKLAVGGDGEDEHRDGGIPAPPSAPTGAYEPTTVLLLESTYLSHPALFGRDGATRRSKERKALREKTRLGDEQIEGWAVMLGRDPKMLQKLKDKHLDLSASSNHPAPPASSPNPPQSSSRPSNPNSGGEGTRGGRGGRGGGRGRGDGSGRGRGDGGRAQHQRRQRGNDRKMAKMGAL